MTYHESRMPLGVSDGLVERDHARRAGRLRHQGAATSAPPTGRRRKGRTASNTACRSIFIRSFSTTTRTLLQKAGLLGDDGKPKGLDGAANWDAALAKLTTGGVVGLSVPTADGATMWRIFYTLLNQQDGEFLKDGKFLDGDNLAKATTAIAEMQKWVKSGWTPAKTEYPASIALFTSGKAAMHINGVWEVPTMVDLAKKGPAVRLGRDPDPDVLRASRDLGGLALVRHSQPQGQPRPCRQAQTRARHHPLVQRTFARMGGRRPYPGLSAGAG